MKQGKNRPLWGDQWRHGSYWDDLARLRVRIKTASAALMDPGEQTTVAVTLDDIATDMDELSHKARRELEG
jgi:hypothetical protein